MVTRRCSYADLQWEESIGNKQRQKKCNLRGKGTPENISLELNSINLVFKAIRDKKVKNKPGAVWNKGSDEHGPRPHQAKLSTWEQELKKDEAVKEATEQQKADASVIQWGCISMTTSSSVCLLQPNGCDLRVKDMRKGLENLLPWQLKAAKTSCVSGVFLNWVPERTSCEALWV